MEVIFKCTICGEYCSAENCVNHREMHLTGKKMDDIVPRMLTVAEAEQKTGIPDKQIRAFIHDGKIKAVQAKNKYYVNEKSLIDYLNTTYKTPFV